jgi:hypothetical protein
MIDYNVTVSCRPRNAIGIFTAKAFVVKALPSVNREEIFMAWRDQYGDKWDPYHLIGFSHAVIGYAEVEGTGGVPAE